MKWIEYDYVCNAGKGINLHKKVEYNEENLLIAQSEACNGEYTITEDSKVVEKQPLPIDLGGTDATTPTEARQNLGIVEVKAFTTLPASGTILTANAEYKVASTVGTYRFAFPASGDVYVRFKTAATFAISFTTGTVFLGEVPKFEGGKTYELMSRDDVVVAAEVVSG